MASFDSHFKTFIEGFTALKKNGPQQEKIVKTVILGKEVSQRKLLGVMAQRCDFF